MAYCCVTNCHNASHKGFLMKKIPRDPNRRALWIKNINRKNWSPKDATYICEVHFEPHMWEKPRDDGKRVLKLSAVPTIFSNNESKKQDLNSNHELLPEDFISRDDQVHNNKQVDTTTDMFPAPLTEIPNTVRTPSEIPTPSKSENILSSPRILTASNKTIFVTKSTKDLVQFLDKRNRQLKNRLKIYKKKLSIQLQKNKAKTSEYEGILRSMFSDDQIRYLRAKHDYKQKKIHCWANATIKDALQLKSICGTKGYEELLKKNLPLPSLRTLRSRSENFKFEGDIIDELITIKIQKN